MNIGTKIAEQKYLKDIQNRLKEERKSVEKGLEVISDENLERLKELREGGSGSGYGYSDFDVFLQQLEDRNAAFDIKGQYRKLEELGYLINEPYFSRIDLVDPENNKEQRFYIGKFAYTEDGPVITDWRTKIASVYYRYRYPQKGVSYETPSGKQVRDLKLKRTYEIDSGELIKYYNNDLQLDENEIIIEKIEGRTGGVLEDIVQTIQESQLDIIESDPRQICIIQGCVGSGKSTVAIHKLAHIFFNFPKVIRPERSVLVTKGQILSGYLATLFPKLGIFDVTHKTLREIVIHLIFREKLKLKPNLDLENDTSEFNLEKIRQLQKDVESVHKLYEEKINDVFSNPDLEGFASFKYSKDETPLENLDEILLDINEELINQKTLLKEDPDSASVWFYKENIRELRGIIKSINRLRGSLVKSTIDKLCKKYGINTESEVGYLKTLIYVYIHTELLGIQEFRKFEYCVIDEAQDFSPLEYLVLSKIVLRGRFALFGDLNQSLEADGISSWEDVPGIIKEAKQATNFILDTNYRCTKPIVDFANSIMNKYTKDYLPKSINRKGSEPEKVMFESKDLMLSTFKEQIDEDIKVLGKSIGIICFGDDVFERTKEMLQNNGLPEDKFIVLDSKKKISYIPKGIYLMKAPDCKGLEFAKVYVLNLDVDKVKSFEEAKKAFVAVTRAMNELKVYGTI